MASWMSDLLRDTRFGLRLFRRSRGFSAIAILTLAVAIGANTAVFAVVNALLFDPLPVTAPGKLASIRFGPSRMSWPNCEEVRARRDIFTDVAAKRPTVAGVGIQDLPARLSGEMTAPVGNSCVYWLPLRPERKRVIPAKARRIEGQYLTVLHLEQRR